MIIDFSWQERQGFCPYCGFEFIDFLRDKKTEKDFIYCIGFVEPTLDYYGLPYAPKKDLMGDIKLVIGFECPFCFHKSGFHVYSIWKDRYSEWIEA